MANKVENVAWPEWETVRLIGRGSFGAVYEIQKDIFGDVEKAALKVISIPQNESDIDEMYSDGYDEESITATFQSHLKSIIAEYSLMRKMNSCINIVTCDDVRYVQHDDGVGWDIFIKMELLTPLTKVLPTDVSEELVIQLGMDMCKALEMCNKYNVIHRDIKPQNIFVSDDGVYKLGDFGIAKTVEKTMGGTKIGTYKYMAPEVYNNRPYGTGADIYSLGLVMYWLLNERRMPFLPLPPTKLMAGMEERARQRRFDGEPLPVPAHGSEKLKQIVLKACAYDPKDRFASATEMLEALKQLDFSTVTQGQFVPIPTLEPHDQPAPTPTLSPEPVPAFVAVPQPRPLPVPDIQIRFLNMDGSVIQSRGYYPGEMVTPPEMALEFERDGNLYRFVGWNPALPAVAKISTDCHVVYEKKKRIERPVLTNPKHGNDFWLLPTLTVSTFLFCFTTRFSGVYPTSTIINLGLTLLQLLPFAIVTLLIVKNERKTYIVGIALSMCPVIVFSVLYVFPYWNTETWAYRAEWILPICRFLPTYLITICVSLLSKQYLGSITSIVAAFSLVSYVISQITIWIVTGTPISGSSIATYLLSLLVPAFIFVGYIILGRRLTGKLCISHKIIFLVWTISAAVITLATLLKV